MSRAARVISFLQSLPITKGPLAGKKMKLLSSQREFVEAIYGDLDDKGIRRKRIGIKSEPKGNGKTGLVAGLVLAHLLGPESEARGEVYSAAIDRGQAALIFNEIEAIILQTPAFAARVNIQRFMKKIEVLSGDGMGSIYEAMSADARRAHGLSPTLFVYDELAQAPNRVLLDNLMNGLGKRKEALALIISTQAPDDSHPLSQMIDDGLSGADQSMFVQLIAAPMEADPFDEATWFACNPALGKYISLKEMREAAARARRIPAFEPSFRNLRLNQRVDARDNDRIVTGAVWKLGNQPVDRTSLAGRKCFGALDLSAKHDLTSLTLAFPSDEEEPLFDILQFCWTPAGTIADRQASEQERFRDWIRAGHIETTPGATVRYEFVASELSRLAREFDIQVIGFDRWRIDEFKVDLREVDPDFPVPLEPFGQGFKEMGPACDWFAELAVTGRIRHGGHPVLTAAVAGAITTKDPAGNIKLDKAKSDGRGPVRIDPAVTLVMSLALAKRFEAVPVVDVDDFLKNVVIA
ncbi:terminase large subunit [Aureimonas phyllosphaerae]|uniref:Phage terminase large subunit-like protein n=1 Tax=Aureimonas phyllosphaerae TaxID=1166078 RepID=A0A7W6BLX6_9HYPH|nr:terminase TerL endonuclease subunit [Aureimonas phyllosphaerae]MBB3934281.1 phage terminase large subunit-like protein [Aureimonas phyllosphaerae]MBB3958503.1 phage terminase large subunit-like protein [Aureimonas phyllosphaerae]